MRCDECQFIVPKPRARRREPWIPPTADVGALLPGGVLRERYRLIDMLGRGAHGVTYLAEHELLTYACAVKLLPDIARDDGEPLVRRQRSEARAGYRVRHPNVVRLLDCDVVAGLWYMVMEYVDGVDLQALLQIGRPPWQQVVSLARDAAAGLSAIHHLGLVHRDVKPGNLILGTDGKVRVADLGVASLVDSLGPRDEAVGTLEYAAPEVFESGAQVDHRADLYGLGATLFHLMTGAPPHAAAGSLASLLDRHTRGPAWPADSVAASPEWIRTIVGRLLAPDPADRFISADAVIEALDAGTDGGARPGQSVQMNGQLPAARGIAVLSFRNEGGDEAENWIGYALADGLGRALKRFPGVYVAEQEHIREIADRLTASDGIPGDVALRRAGRLVGAATIVSGWFRREGDVLQVGLACSRTADEAIVRSADPLTAALADMPALQEQLLSRTARLLDLTAAGIVMASARPHTLDAHRRFVLGKQAYLRGRFDDASQQAEAALALDPEYIDPLQYAGAAYARLGRYDIAQAYHQRQEAIAEQRGDIRLAVEARANLGVMNYFRGEYAQAYEYCSRAAETAESIGLTAELAHIYNNLGFTLLKLGRLDEAERAYERAIEKHQAFGALASLIGPYNGLGNLLMERGRYEEAGVYFRKAQTLAEEVGDVMNVGVSQMNLGRTAALSGRYDVAQVELAAALATLEATSFWNGLARAYEYIADVDLRTGNYAEALRCVERRLQLARLHKNAAMEESAMLQKAEALELAGRRDTAAACRAEARQVAIAQAEKN